MKVKHIFPMFVITLLTAALAVFANAASPDNVWTQVDKDQLEQRGLDGTALPRSYETFKLNKYALDRLLNEAPEEFTNGRDVILSLPMPDGTYTRFRIEHSLVVEPGLLKQFPELGATYRGYGIDDPTATVRFDVLPSGFHSMILSTSGTVIVDPYQKGDTENYLSYYKHDRPAKGNFECQVKGTGFEPITRPKRVEARDFITVANEPEITSGTQLRTYRLAVAATREYTAAVGGGTVAGALAAQVLIMNRVNGIYERDLAIHMNIIANNNLIVYTAEPDGYDNDDGFAMLDQNQSKLDSVILSANYDIGHVFSTGGGGVAFLEVPCQAGAKAGGVTGLTNPIGDNFAVDYVAHEMGHQFGGDHTFNTSCGGNRESSAAYEPGSGITIMGYAGVCDTQDLAAHSIDTFHFKTLDQIVAYTQGGAGDTCDVPTATGNTPPTAPSVTGSPFNIPRQTPFSLTASSTDANGDTITYDWQEYDLGASTSAVPNTDATGTPPRPIFRPYLPSTNGTRIFPALTYILNNANVPPGPYDCGFGLGGNACMTGELLPTVNRTMNFRVVARDNRANGGGINTSTAQVIVSSAAGPFLVTSPNTAVNYQGNSSQTVTWDVANTTAAPVSAASVDILLSTDGGNTFPTVILAGTPNDGTQAVTIPNLGSTTARIKVQATGKIFFDISNTNFTITAIASNVDVSGRVFGRGNRGMAGAQVTITDQAGTPRTVTANSLGIFNFTNVLSGQTYTISVSARRHTYLSQTIPINSNLSNVNFTPQP